MFYRQIFINRINYDKLDVEMQAHIRFHSPF